MTADRATRLAVSLSIALLLPVALGLFVSSGARADSSELFVTPSGSGDCSRSAPCDLPTALEAAGDEDSVYIAAGTYTGDGEAVVSLLHDIALYGGWDGAASGAIHRDPSVHVSVLDGEDERRVIFIGPNTDVTIDGLTITGGNATGATEYPRSGGGIGGRATIAHIAHNVIRDNVASESSSDWGFGGGIYLENAGASSIPTIIEVNQIDSNIASTAHRGWGGGVYLSHVLAAQLLNNTVLSNTASTADQKGYGGGLRILGCEGAIVSANDVRFNIGTRSGEGRGGGIEVDSCGDAEVSHNVVLSNTASMTNGLGYGGGLALLSSNRSTVASNRVEYNVAQAGPAPGYGSKGGGIYSQYSDDVSLLDNVLRHNIASTPSNGSGGGIALWTGDGITVSGNVMQDNWGATGSGNGYGGGLYTYGSRDLLIDANWITDNHASASKNGWGGGISVGRDSVLTMTNNIIAVNCANKKGGGINFNTDGDLPIQATLVHNTFVANDEGQDAGRVAIYAGDSLITLELTNNLLSRHTVGVYVGEGSSAELYNTLFFNHSEGITGGDGAISNVRAITGQPPLLTGDYHLSSDSPAIDAGRTVAWLRGDFDGDQRPQGGGYDIGADEFARPTIWLPLVPNR